MRYVLTDYQECATADLVRRLRQASREYQQDKDFSAVSLTAPTGAGKTVIATAVIERLFFGDEQAPADEKAVVLWITDNPSLNEQTKRKMVMSSTALKPAHLVTIDQAFDQELLDAHRVYFLNIQKLARTSSMVQAGVDARRWSLWDTLARSIRHWGGHLYVVIDEAHRGTGTADRSRPTIVKRIISDPDRQLPPTPIVWGISATPDRFQAAMAAASEPSRTQRDVKVSPEDVRASGLLKDTLDVRHPKETQPSDATLTRQAAENLKAMTERWEAYSTSQGEPLVVPALVVQVRAQVSEAAVAEMLAVLKDAWSVLSDQAVGHSFETHATLNVNGQPVRYVAPEDIQDDPTLRVVLFKEALTTGWDCPRAETMLSFRKAEDFTYIAQLIGRMVRTPLARRVTTDDSLNAVAMFLPYYDKKSVEQVIDRLRTDPNSPPLEVAENAVVCPINDAISNEAKAAVEAVPTYTVPGQATKSQVARLHALATRMAGDGIIENAVDKADQHLIATIEREKTRLDKQGKYEALVRDIGQIDVGRLIVSLRDGTQVSADEQVATDSRDINHVFRAARRGFRDGLATRYWSWLLDKYSDPKSKEHLGPDDAKLVVSALASDLSVVEAVERAAAELVRRWLKDHARAIGDLSAAAKAAYQAVRQQALDSEESAIALRTTLLGSGAAEATVWERHLYSTKDGQYPAVLNEWEAEVVRAELARGAVAWYRNPRGGDHAVRIPYRESDGEYDKPFYPDFVFVHDTPDGIRPSIVDPHNYAMADTVPKWRGLAAYAEAHGHSFHRIDAVIKDTDGNLLRLDLLDPTNRKGISNAEGKDQVLGVFRDLGGAY
jgi:type III restriction enzyme